MKSREYEEGPTAFDRFRKAMKAIVSAPKAAAPKNKKKKPPKS